MIPNSLAQNLLDKTMLIVEYYLNCRLQISLVSEIPVAYKEAEPSDPQQQQLAAATDCSGRKHMGPSSWVRSHGCYWAGSQGYSMQRSLCPSGSAATTGNHSPGVKFDRKPPIRRKRQPQQPLKFLPIIYFFLQSHHHCFPFVLTVHYTNISYGEGNIWELRW